MMSDILFALWVFLPAGIANTTPIFAGKLPFLKSFSQPIDLHRSINGKRIFGDHKTIRGFVTGIIVSILVVSIQKNIYIQNEFMQQNFFINYELINSFLFGSLLGGGSLLGDAVESFFKRQNGIASGRTWFPFDQIDYIIGGIILSSFYIQLSFYYYLLIFIIWFFMHLIFSYIGYLLTLKKTPI